MSSPVSCIEIRLSIQEKGEKCLDYYDAIVDKKLHLEWNLPSDYKFLFKMELCIWGLLFFDN